MRRLSANYVYCVSQPPIKNGIVELDDKGKILSVIDTKGELKESRNLEFYNGVIVPGFINTHCHLELSELKGAVSEKLGLPDFLESIFEYKKLHKQNTTFESIKLFDKIMTSNGIVAVGDICNTANTISVKNQSKILYHNFIEAIGIGENAETIFSSNKDLYNRFVSSGLQASIVPHASYSVSKKLFQLIKEHSENQDLVISIHNQETKSENELFNAKTGELFEKLSSLGVDYKNWKATGENSVKTISKYLPLKSNILFIHNTYTQQEDISFVNKRLERAFWCLCPLSNKYIENKFPNFELFLKYTDRVTLGTDSLASNKVLSILEEMKCITENCKKISFNELLN